MDRNEFFTRLDAASDYEALTKGFYGEARRTGSELWLKCPFDEGTPEDKFSVNIATGQWRNHKTDESGAFISLVKRTHASSWRDEWVRICPNTQDVLFKKRDTHRGSGTSSSPKSGRKSFASRWAAGLKDQDPKDLEIYAEGYGVPVKWMLEHRMFTMKGGRYGNTPRLMFAGVDPKTLDVVALKMRMLTADIPIKGGAKLKSKNLAGSSAGLIGWDPHDTRPKLLVEGEKDWVVAAFEFTNYHCITNTNGASSWKDEWTDALADQDITILYDEDEAGLRGARKVASRCLSRAKSVRIAHLPGPDKDLFDHLRGEGIGKEGVQQILTDAKVFDPKGNPLEVDAYIRAACMNDDMEPNTIADVLFNCMLDNGGMFMQIDDREAFCAWRGRVYDCHPKNKFWQALVYKYTGCDAGSSEGRRIILHLEMLAVSRGQAVEQTTWYARRDKSLFLPLYGAEQKMVEISEDHISVVPNGYKEVVLMPVSQISEITFLNDEQYDPEKAEKAWVKLWNFVNCSLEWRELVSAAVLALPFYDWCETHPLLRFQGMTGSGKSFATKAMTTLLYGQPENQGGDTMAALYRMAGSRMLLALDNLEDTNLRRSPDLKDLMLRAASGMTRAKSAADSERAIVAQRVTCWIMSTGKSPIGVGYEDMEERLVVVPVGGNEQQGFYGTGVIAWVEENRDLLYSYLIRRCQAVLRAINAGEHLRLLRQFPREQRHRLHEWYALLALARGDRETPSPTVLEWLRSAHEGESESVISSDQVVPLLTMMPSFLADEYTGKQFKFVETRETGRNWKATIHTAILHSLLSSIARATGQRYTQSSAKSLGYHLRSLARRSEEYGITLNRVDSRTAIPGSGKRDRAWDIILEQDVIKPFLGDAQREIWNQEDEDPHNDRSDELLQDFVDEEGNPRF